MMMGGIICLLIAISTNITAQTADTMNVKLRSGVEIPYAISSLKVLTFSGVQGKDTMNVKLKFGPTIEYSISILDQISFSNNQSSDTILIGLTDGNLRSYSVSSISALSFTGWDNNTSIEPLAPEALKGYILGQNYPNPFYPHTTIQYYLPTRQMVEITVTTLTGQLIAYLVQEQQSSGIHQVKWDASTVACGIYFYQLRAGEYKVTKKMILLKQ